jgi:hypothetical protein
MERGLVGVECCLLFALTGVDGVTFFRGYMLGAITAAGGSYFFFIVKTQL